MTNRFALRCVADVLVGLAALALAFLASKHAQSAPWLIAAVTVVALAAVLAGYYEPSGKRVIVHPFLLMAPELIAFPAAFITCEGFECGAYIGVLMMASLLTFILIGLSLAAFFLRRQLLPKL